MIRYNIFRVLFAVTNVIPPLLIRQQVSKWPPSQYCAHWIVRHHSTVVSTGCLCHSIWRKYTQCYTLLYLYFFDDIVTIQGRKYRVYTVRIRNCKSMVNIVIVMALRWRWYLIFEESPICSIIKRIWLLCHRKDFVSHWSIFLNAMK